MKPLTMQEAISHYRLIPHIEGGYYYRTFRSDIITPKASLPSRFEGDRTIASSILYLVPGDVKSKLHRLKSDEIWHFYLGNPFVLIELQAQGDLKQTRLGHDILKGEQVQHLVPHSCWFGGYVVPDGIYSFSLLGCTIFPGFDEQDLELGDKAALLSQFPQHKEIILPFFDSKV